MCTFRGKLITKGNVFTDAHFMFMSSKIPSALSLTCCYAIRMKSSSAAFVWDSVNAPLSLTLQDSHQSCADTRHNVTEQPLFESVDFHPADDRQQRESCVLGPFGVTSEAGRNRNTGKTVTAWTGPINV